MREEIIDICLGNRSLTPSISEKLMALGETSTSELVKIATDIWLYDEDFVGEGYVPVIAAQELANRKETKAFKPLLMFLEGLAVNDEILEELCKCIGSLLTIENLEYVIDLHNSNHYDGEFERSIAYVLYYSGFKDERIFNILLEEMCGDSMIAGFLADYGNPNAIPHLMEQFDYLEADNEEFLQNRDLIEIECSIRTLGGTLSDSQKKKMKIVRKTQDKFRDHIEKFFDEPGTMDLPNKKKIGRNDPCTCGSGKKYKKCCLLN